MGCIWQKNDGINRRFVNNCFYFYLISAYISSRMLTLKAAKADDGEKHTHREEHAAKVRHVVAEHGKLNGVCKGHNQISEVDH